MAMLVGQLIEILKQFDQDREVKGYFPKDDEYFYLTDLDVVPRD